MELPYFPERLSQYRTIAVRRRSGQRRSRAALAGYSAIKAGWLKTTIAGFACQPSPTAAPERADVRIIVENGQNLISSRTAFLSNAKIQPFWKMEIVDDYRQFQNSDHGEYGSCA
jgi:hypothetical protein